MGIVCVTQVVRFSPQAGSPEEWQSWAGSLARHGAVVRAVGMHHRPFGIKIGFGVGLGLASMIHAAARRDSLAAEACRMR
jgi:hypothetical protein